MALLGGEGEARDGGFALRLHQIAGPVPAAAPRARLVPRPDAAHGRGLRPPLARQRIHRRSFTRPRGAAPRQLCPLFFFFCFLLFLAHQPLIASMEQIIVPSIGTFSLKCSFFSAVGAGRVATAAAAHLHPHHLLGSVAEDRNAGQTKRNGTAVALHGSGTPPLPLVPSSFWNKLELASFTFSLCPLCWH